MKLENTTAHIWCIMLWYEERKQVDKMKRTIEVLSVIDIQKDRAYLFGEVLDLEYKVNI